MANSWFVYILQTEKGKLYTGIAIDIEKRFFEHLFSNKGAKFFRSDAPEKIVYFEIHESRSNATKREIQIKKMSRNQKLVLIQTNPV